MDVGVVVVMKVLVVVLVVSLVVSVVSNISLFSVCNLDSELCAGGVKGDMPLVDGVGGKTAPVHTGVVATAPSRLCRFSVNFFVFPMSLMLNPFFLMAFNTADVP